ncbi:MAG: DNA polymerase III subunit delta [Hyphomicrobiaceae bacterium]
MVAVKTKQANAFLKAPDAALSCFLFFGPDTGLVSERARQLAQTLARRSDPPGEIIHVEEQDLEQDPDRLAVELRTVAMFGGRSVVRVTAGRRINTAMLRPLVTEGGLEGALIVEAGNLRPDEALRALFEKSAQAAAVACFPDDAADLDALIRDTLAAADLAIAPGARQLLMQRLGGDRALSRGEIEKLTLYALGKGTVSEEDVEAAVGDAAEMLLDRVVQAAAAGEAGTALQELDRAMAAGESAQTIALALQRHVLRLHRLRGAMDAGRSFDDLVRTMRPPPHFKIRDALQAQCRQWTLPQLGRALDRIGAAIKGSRTAWMMEDALVRQLLLDVARLARQGAQGQRRH